MRKDVGMWPTEAAMGIERLHCVEERYSMCMKQLLLKEETTGIVHNESVHDSGGDISSIVEERARKDNAAMWWTEGMMGIIRNLSVPRLCTMNDAAMWRTEGTMGIICNLSVLQLCAMKAFMLAVATFAFTLAARKDNVGMWQTEGMMGIICNLSVHIPSTNVDPFVCVSEPTAEERGRGGGIHDDRRSP